MVRCVKNKFLNASSIIDGTAYIQTLDNELFCINDKGKILKSENIPMNCFDRDLNKIINNKNSCLFGYPFNLKIIEYNNKFGAIDEYNNYFLKFEYDDILHTTSNLWGMKNEKWFIINSDSSIKELPFQKCENLITYEGNMICNYNYVVIQQNNKFGLSDYNGQIIIEPQFDNIYSLDDGQLLKVLKNDKVGYYNLSGKEIIPCMYKNLYFGLNDGLIAAEEYSENPYNKMGYINDKNEIIIPFIYEFYSQPFYNGVAIVNVNCEYKKYIKTNGEDLF